MIRTFLFRSRPNHWLEAVWNTYAHHTINFHKLFFPRLLNDKSRNCQWFKLRLFYIIYRLVTDIQNAQTLWQLIFNAIEAQNPSIINDERYAHFQANRKIRGGGPDLIGLFAPTNCTYNRWHFHHHHHWQCPWYDSVARARILTPFILFNKWNDNGDKMNANGWCGIKSLEWTQLGI